MTLSVIIVNYNARDLLLACLRSVGTAIRGIDAEVFVVDNSSFDGSIDSVRTRFPWVNCIVNDSNPGFARANNQALALAKGKFVLFLNPDTEVPHDCLRLCIDFMDRHTDAGALGAKMLNADGRFLKESKRGFPGPLVSFWKLTGFTGLFPRSPLFARYYLGHLSEHETHAVDVLSGAFMFVRKEVLDITGGFDERFFMYAEDIDLSYRITRAGYKNYYFAETTILHHKGGSTTKNAANTRQFYYAMSQFVKKYYGNGVFPALLDVAIWLRSRIALLFGRR